MVRLTAAQRDRLPASDFALPGRQYPIHDSLHGASALGYVKKHGSVPEMKTVYRKVCRRYRGVVKACDVGLKRWLKGDGYAPARGRRKKGR